jgi:hypothetical protein
MLSATLEAGLTDYAIVAKIRTLRLKKKMGLHAQGQVERSHRRRGARARVRRLDVLRLWPSPWVPPRRHVNMLRDRGHDSLTGGRTILGTLRGITGRVSVGCRVPAGAPIRGAV